MKWPFKGRFVCAKDQSNSKAPKPKSRSRLYDFLCAVRTHKKATVCSCDANEGRLLHKGPKNHHARKCHSLTDSAKRNYDSGLRVRLCGSRVILSSENRQYINPVRNKRKYPSDDFVCAKRRRLSIEETEAIQTIDDKMGYVNPIYNWSCGSSNNSEVSSLSEWCGFTATGIPVDLMAFPGATPTLGSIQTYLSLIDKYDTDLVHTSPVQQDTITIYDDVASESEGFASFNHDNELEDVEVYGLCRTISSACSSVKEVKRARRECFVFEQ